MFVDKYYPTHKSSFSRMASQMYPSKGKPHVCSIIPPQLLQHILNNSDTAAPTRAAVQKTYNHVCKLQASRVKKDNHHAAPGQGFTAGIIPPQIFQAILQSEETSSEQKARSESNLQYVKRVHTA